MNAIAARGLTKRFGQLSAVAGIDLTIGVGEVVALLGPNGAGKTTALDMILGLTMPTSGELNVLGTTPTQAIRAGRISALLQTGGLLADMTVRETVTYIAAAYPEVACLIVTTFGRPGYLQRALEAGARGFVVKETPAEQLADVVRAVHAGQRVIDPALATEALFSGANPLTEREREILRLALDGGTVADIAARVYLSEGTVRNHLSAAIGKMGVRTRAEAARAARDLGWL
ncbi:ATP-binding cassette domain-containing protein [Trueperella pecoris]|uniref:ATP-binding cassette domain-containing protein n=1 Tax=Trueperella pecoris TaxID=2733571 RepID=A0A7M1QV83_9ACTO|nr:LuxR C-terminal-related transcriptional regulator [Trueperella pecoris]QOR45711.1 ATP-binding cassette domain-containing protein [Trueperella pecoris]